MQYSSFSFKFTFTEKLLQVPLAPEDYNITPPPLRIASPPRVATVYNKLTGEREGAGVSPSKHPVYLAPALCMFGLLSVLFSGISHSPQLGF
jgi:hypothetical protein